MSERKNADAGPDERPRRYRAPSALSFRAILWKLFIILSIFWLAERSFHVADRLVYLLLVVAAIILIYSLVTGR